MIKHRFLIQKKFNKSNLYISLIKKPLLIILSYSLLFRETYKYLIKQTTLKKL